MNNETRTVSMLQRVPAILAVTASSYGLSLQAREARKSRAPECRHDRRHQAGAGARAAGQR